MTKTDPEADTLPPAPAPDLDPDEQFIAPLRAMVRDELHRHEQTEAAVAADLRVHVDRVEATAARERQELSAKIDLLSQSLRQDVKEAAIHVADRFLEPVGLLIRDVTSLKTRVDRLEHELGELVDMLIEE